jgi:hypothetical protein
VCDPVHPSIAQVTYDGDCGQFRSGPPSLSRQKREMSVEKLVITTAMSLCVVFLAAPWSADTLSVQNEMSVMIKKTIWILLAVTVLAFVLRTTVRADDRNKTSVVPAIAIDVTSLSLTDLESVPIVPVTRDESGAAMTAVIRSRPLPNVAARVSAMGTAGVTPPAEKASHPTHLPQTAGALPLIVLLSIVSIGIAFGLLIFGRRRGARGGAV